MEFAEILTIYFEKSAEILTIFTLLPKFSQFFLPKVPRFSHFYCFQKQCKRALHPWGRVKCPLVKRKMFVGVLGRLGRILYHFSYGGMDVDNGCQLVDGGVAAHQGSYLLYHVGTVGTEGVASQQGA